MHCFRQKQVLGSEVVSSLLTYVECGKNGANSRRGKTQGHAVTLCCALLQAPILALDSRTHTHTYTRASITPSDPHRD